MIVAKWGNSLAVRIPADVIRNLDLKEGDQIHLRAAKDGVIEVISEAQRREEVLASLREFRGRMPADFKFDRDEINSRGPD